MSAAETISKINKSIEKLYSKNDIGEPKPIVCLLCDRFVKTENLTYITTECLKRNKHLFLPNPSFNLDENLKQDYTIITSTYQSLEDNLSLAQCMFSPRSQYIHQEDSRRRSGFTICLQCDSYITRKAMPLFCIANNYAFGMTPPCLLQLTQVELAMITPVRTFGYCFCYTGGTQKQLKGSLSYYKVSTETIIRTGAQLERIGLNNHIIILMYGSMTVMQKKMAKQNYKINSAKIITAVKWLLDNNCHWRPYRNKYDEIVSSITSPFW